jgi:chromate reductase
LKLTEAPPFADFPLYNADVQDKGIPPAALTLAEAVRAADGVIFNSPEYNFSIPGGLKNAIDWLSRVPNQPLPANRLRSSRRPMAPSAAGACNTICAAR